MKYGFVGLFYYFCLWVLLLSVYHTLVQELRRHFLVFVVPFWSAFFGTQCRKSVEFWKKRCILGYIWIASIVRVMREWFPFNRLQIFTIAPIVRIELEAIVNVPIVRVVLVISVVFPYDEQATQVAFDYSE